MSSVERPVTRAIYLLVLSASEPSPLLPETGDEPIAAAARADTRPAAPVGVRIDFDRIGQRILALNVPAGDYGMLMAGAPGTIFYTDR
jgi:tricorn protease